MSKPNRGKDFEKRIFEAFNKLEDVSIDRIPDQMSGYTGSKNVSDFIMYAYPYQYYIECKAFYGNTINFDRIPQLDDLCNKDAIQGVSAGCMLWFIDHDITVWIRSGILKSWKEAGNKSVNIKAVKNNKIAYMFIKGDKKRVFFDYDMKPFLGRW